MKKYLALFALLGIFTVAGCNCGCDKTIHFNVNSAELSSQDKEMLDKVAETVNKNNSKKVEITGYTDSTGNKDYNIMLSKKRAAAAANYLQSKGVDSKRITIGAFGQSNPVATNKTTDGRHENRRVNIRIYK